MKNTEHAEMLEEYEQMQVVREAFKDLVDEGEIQIIGRFADGEPVYGSTKPRSTPKRVWRALGIIGVFPAFVAEYTLSFAALALVRLRGPLELVYVLADIAGRLGSWRMRYATQPDYWLSIKS